MTDSTNRADIEALMAEAFGMSVGEHHLGSHSPFPRAHLNVAVRTIEKANLSEHLAAWRIEDGIDPRGRKGYMSLESALIVMLMSVREGKGVLFSEMANMLAHRLSREDFALIGIPYMKRSQQAWYDLHWRTVERLVNHIDAQPGPRRKLLSGAEHRAVLEGRDPIECAKKQIRLDFFCNQLIQGSVDTIPRRFRRNYKGNVAFDATFYHLHGKEGNPKFSEIDEDRRSTNYDGGWYKRGGDHNGEAGGHRDVLKWGLELETATMAPNRPGESPDFPLLTIGVGSHRPGKLKLEGKKLFESIRSRGHPVGYVFADTAYLPGAAAFDLQGPLLNMGYELVFDYGKNEYGKTAYFEHAIQVVGQWYHHLMPSTLVNAEKLYHQSPYATDEQKAARTALRDARREQRELYRLKPKGVRRPDGSQQYMYPDPANFVCFDEITGEIIPPLKKRTVVIPFSVGLKFGQKFPFKSEKWKAWYALRSRVEGSYSHVKNTETENLDNAANRRKRGSTFAYLAATLAMVSANLRKILAFIAQLASPNRITSKNSKSPMFEIIESVEALVVGLEPPIPD